MSLLKAWCPSIRCAPFIKSFILALPGIYMVAVLTLIYTLVFVNQYKFMGNVPFHSCYASWILAFYNILNPFRQGKVNLFCYHFIFDYINCYVCIQKSQHCIIDVYYILNFYDILFPHFIAACIHDEGNGEISLSKLKILEYLKSHSRSYVVNNQSLFNACYIQHLLHPQKLKNKSHSYKHAVFYLSEIPGSWVLVNLNRYLIHPWQGMEYGQVLLGILQLFIIHDVAILQSYIISLVKKSFLLNPCHIEDVHLVNYLFKPFNLLELYFSLLKDFTSDIVGNLKLLW